MWTRLARHGNPVYYWHLSCLFAFGRYRLLQVPSVVGLLACSGGPRALPCRRRKEMDQCQPPNSAPTPFRHPRFRLRASLPDHAAASNPMAKMTGQRSHPFSETRKMRGDFAIGKERKTLPLRGRSDDFGDVVVVIAPRNKSCTKRHVGGLLGLRLICAWVRACISSQGRTVSNNGDLGA